MKITTRVLLIISVSVTSIIVLIFTILLKRFEKQMEADLLTRARTVYKNILTVRKWVSDHGGVYVFKSHGMQSNPYLPNPDVITINGDTLTLKNPALVTRELSELSRIMGGDFAFHMSSRQFINPINRPDDFEETALRFFEERSRSTRQQEFYKKESKDGRQYFRYFAPLFAEESCLTCHSQQGYRTGDLRGGISILISIDNYLAARRSNLRFFFVSGVLSILFLGVLMFVSLQRSIIRPLRRIETAAHRMQEGDYDFPVNVKKNDEIGHLAQAFETMRTNMKLYMERLAASEQKYRSLIEHSQEAIAVIDPDGRILDCNSRLSRLTGYSAEELLNMNIHDFLSSKRQVISIPDRQSVEFEHYESTLVSRDNLKIPVEIYRIKNFQTDEFENVSFVYVRDLSERKKIEQYSIQAEKMFALGQLSSGIAHEIRNPLFALNNNLEFLGNRYKEDAAFQEVYQEMKDSVERIHKIVSGILDYARPHELEFKQVDIRAVIENALMLVKKQFEKSSIGIETHFEEGGCEIEADPHQLEQVFINLFLNAFQAMADVGQLKIVVKSTSNGVEVVVQDTGRGIPEKDLTRIFDPFYTTFPNGTGLGLAIVQRILQQHRATIHVKSEPGLGTTFTIYFPRKQR